MQMKNLQENWDLVVIGGGITGAGVFREATRMGLKVLLVERMDFAWGTSSRSTKLVHGGLRYLKDGHPLLTKTSVEERERMLKEAPGLVEQVGFLMPVYRVYHPANGRSISVLSSTISWRVRNNTGFTTLKSSPPSHPILSERVLREAFSFSTPRLMMRDSCCA